MRPQVPLFSNLDATHSSSRSVRHLHCQSWPKLLLLCTKHVFLFRNLGIAKKGQAHIRRVTTLSKPARCLQVSFCILYFGYDVFIDLYFSRQRSKKHSSEHTTTRTPFVFWEKMRVPVRFVCSRPLTGEKTLEGTSTSEIKKESKHGLGMAPTTTDAMGGAEA